MEKTKHYDVADHLRTPEEAQLYLEACNKESGGDKTFMDKAHDDVARAGHSTTLHIAPAAEVAGEPNEIDDGQLTVEDIKRIRKAAEPMLPKGEVINMRSLLFSKVKQ